jgi:hypothetical protein
MKKLLTLVAVALLFLGACKKDKTEEVAASSTWTLGGTTYKSLITYKTTTSGGTPMTLINFYDATPSATVKVNALAMSFVESPSASATYQLVGVGQAKTAKQFEISAGTSAGLAYAYIGPAAVDVTITVTGGKVKVTIPEIAMKGTTATPDVKLTATVQEM